MSAAAGMYSAHGPVRGQDGRPVWVVVRQLEDCTRLVAVAEAVTAQAAWEHAKSLNTAAERASAHGLDPEPMTHAPRPVFLPAAWPFPLSSVTRRLAPRRAAAPRMPAGDDAPF